MGFISEGATTAPLLQSDLFRQSKAKQACRRRAKIATSKNDLSRRAINALKKARIITLGQLINRAQAGIVGLTGLGQFKGLEIVASLDALSEAAGMKGSIDWVKLCENSRVCGFA